jgi:hypothetical protein
MSVRRFRVPRSSDKQSVVSSIKLICVVVLVVLAVPGAVFAQSQAESDIDALEDHMKKVRAELVGKRDSALRALLVMTEEQDSVFRPLQQEYDRELKKLGKASRDMIREFGKVYDTLNARSAAEIAQRFFDLERDRLALQEKYYQRIADDVSPVIAVQFIQLQRRFEARYEVERQKYSPIAE